MAGQLLIDGPLKDSCVDVVPVTNTFPMGFGWSSYVAQSVMVDACLKSGFSCQQLLSAERVLPKRELPVLAIGTDDVNLFERMSPQERADRLAGAPPLARLDRTWNQFGIQRHVGFRMGKCWECNFVRDSDFRQGVSVACLCWK